MAHRHLLRRLLSVTLRQATWPLRSPSSAHLPALTSLCWHGTEPPFHNRASLATARRFCTKPSCDVSFNVQSPADFTDRVINSAKPVVVNFHASWCGPCRMLSPRLEKIVANQEGKVIMAKVDIDDQTDLAMKYKVTAVPTVIAIKGGEIEGRFAGVKSEDELEVFIKNLICPSL
ncbi:thioredoxin, mitochondrial [Leucoraja erinacea]|uniref:thioredoxin, mitochondrial n=1 Tax=Leucoraja erinaceus TaxID=7782 RepID=UPI002458AB28|nr:thioredoxin, mitochondrial [Leucoraja erinacea]XP_055519041.1 thioredoxin, mitochondrial [Leucoraja erinacea]XP_055519042.1 thioredoxin, mitochondrial [Leucoraja erinacea]XP_055519043.1 thioredoxin, mitochondrial [Leucoraja erinacea]